MTSLISLSPENEAKSVDKTERDTPMLVIIISSICGTMTILTIVIAVAFVKYGRWKRSTSSESEQSPDTNIPMNENYNPEYEEIGDVDNNPKGSNQTANNQSTREKYQSLQVCSASLYFQINERPTLHDEVSLEETNTSNYEQMRRSQIEDHADAYQALGNGTTDSEINEMPKSIDIYNHEDPLRSHIAENVVSRHHLMTGYSGNVRNDVQIQSSVQRTIDNKYPTYCNTAI